MGREKDIFAKEGLKIDAERVLTYSRLICPIDCKYCFVDKLNIEQQKDVSYLSPRQLELLGKLLETVSLIMLGCDTEFFQSKTESIEILKKLANLNKDISVVTKFPLAKGFVEKLKEVDDQLRKHKNFLTFSVSIPCLDSAKEWEPNAPNPLERMETLKSVYQSGIKTLVAMRPLLPTITNKELEKIVELTNDYCYGYYSGPLYLKSLDKTILGENQSGLKIEQLQPHWMPEGNVFYKIEKEDQLQVLENILQKYNKSLFEGAAEGIKYLRDHEKH